MIPGLTSYRGVHQHSQQRWTVLAPETWSTCESGHWEKLLQWVTGRELWAVWILEISAEERSRIYETVSPGEGVGVRRYKRWASRSGRTRSNAVVSGGEERGRRRQVDFKPWWVPNQSHPEMSCRRWEWSGSETLWPNASEALLKWQQPPEYLTHTWRRRKHQRQLYCH